MDGKQETTTSRQPRSPSYTKLREDRCLTHIGREGSSLSLALVAYGALALVALLLLRKHEVRIRSPMQWGRRLIVYSLAVVGSAVTEARMLQLHAAIHNTPYAAPESGSFVWTTLSEEERDRWALRVAMSSPALESVDARPPDIPSEWPFPDTVRLAARTDSNGLRVLFSSMGDGRLVCRVILNGHIPNVRAGNDPIDCRPSSANPVWGRLSLPTR